MLQGVGDACRSVCMPFTLETLGLFLLRSLRIGASTVSLVELLRQDWSGALGAGLAWLLFLLVEHRLPPPTEDPGS